MRLILTSILLLAAFAAPASALPIADLFNTGVDSAGVPLPDQTVSDPHYIFTFDSSGSNATKVRTAVGGFPIGPWIADDAISAWIGPNTDSALNGPVGLYVYETTFTLPANADLASVAIAGQWAVDNGDGNSEIHLNGPNVVAAGNGGFTDWTPFAIGPGAGSFVSGVNVMHFVTNNAGGPTGLRVEMTGSYSLVPEPCSCVLCGVGGLGVLLLLRRKPN